MTQFAGSAPPEWCTDKVSNCKPNEWSASTVSVLLHCIVGRKVFLLVCFTIHCCYEKDLGFYAPYVLNF